MCAENELFKMGGFENGLDLLQEDVLLGAIDPVDVDAGDLRGDLGQRDGIVVVRSVAAGSGIPGHLACVDVAHPY